MLGGRKVKFLRLFIFAETRMKFAALLPVLSSWKNAFLRLIITIQ
jgi:hypothetical protein